jgi:hypothetical protein
VKPDDESMRLASKIPRGLRAPVVSSWPVSSWTMRRTLGVLVLTVALAKERVRFAWAVFASPR